MGIQLGRLRQRLAAKRIVLDVTSATAHALAAEGYDPAFGARPLKRVIQRRLEDPIALNMLQGTFKDGDTITVDSSEGALTIT